MKAKQNTKVKILALAQNFTTDMQKWKARGKRDKYTNSVVQPTSHWTTLTACGYNLGQIHKVRSLTWLSSCPWKMVLRTFSTCLDSFLFVMGMTIRLLDPSVSSSCCTLSSSSHKNSWASCWSYPRKAGMRFHTECSMAKGDTKDHRPDHMTLKSVCNSWHRDICWRVEQRGGGETLSFFPTGKFQQPAFPIRPRGYSASAVLPLLTTPPVTPFIPWEWLVLASSSSVSHRSKVRKHSLNFCRWLSTCNIEFM